VGHIRVLRQGVDLRPEDKTLGVGVVIKGPDAQPVPGAKKLSLYSIPQSKSEISHDVSQASCPPHLVGVKD
jgi:hypothetical protein